MGRFLASLFTAAAATPKVGGTRCPVPLSRSAARSHCRTVAPTGREVWQSKDTTTPWGTRLRILQAVVFPPLREETQRQGERRKSAETGGEESIFNP